MAVTELLPVATRGPSPPPIISNTFNVPATTALCRTCSIGRATHAVQSPGHAFVPRTAAFQMNIPDPDRLDPAKIVTLGVQRNVAGVWREEARVQYTGIPFGSPGYFKQDGTTRTDLPGILLQGEEFAGIQIRLGLLVQGPAMQLGVQVDIV